MVLDVYCDTRLEIVTFVVVVVFFLNRGINGTFLQIFFQGPILDLNT